MEWEQLHRSRLTAQDLYAGLLIEIAGFNPFADTHFLGGYMVVVGVCVGI